jgi:peptidoglycan/xylan/chitin deacetylase (PgdA/CDA1 family)
MLRRAIKTGLAEVAHGLGVDEWVGNRAGAGRLPLIIAYHRVVEDFEESSKKAIPAMLVSTRTLERQLDWLGRRFEFVGLDEIAARASEGRSSARPAVAITFDDGYMDVYDNGFPLLLRKGIPFAIFVVSDLIGTARLMVHDQVYLTVSRAFSLWRNPPRAIAALLLRRAICGLALARVVGAARSAYSMTRTLLGALSANQLKRACRAIVQRTGFPNGSLEAFRAVDWEALRAMSRTGVIVGSHTRTHVLLGREEWPRIVEETRTSRQALESGLGVRVEHFAYPDGSFNARVVRAVAGAGYRCAYTTCHHRDGAFPSLTMPRRVFWEMSAAGALGRFSPAVMSCQVNGLFDGLSRCGQRHAHCP